MDFHYKRRRLHSFQTPFAHGSQMDFNHHSGFTDPSDSGSGPRQYQGSDSERSDAFDILNWYPEHESCLQYFLDKAQYSTPVQTLASFINIQLPCQTPTNPVYGYSPPPADAAPSRSQQTGPLPIYPQSTRPFVSLLPYIRRLVATGYDSRGVLHGFFGDKWEGGITFLWERERRNYLFAAKSGSWIEVKKQYDLPDGQLIPFLKPLQNVSEREIVYAETQWSEWLAMQDWMVGPRSPDVARGSAAVRSSVTIKREEP